MLDERTLYVAFVAVYASLAIALVVMWRQVPRQPGVGRLAAAYGIMGAGVALAAFFGVTRAGAPVVLGNAVAVLGAALLLEATREFFHLGRRRWVTLAAVSVGAAITAWFLFVDSNVDERVVWVSLLMAWLAGSAGWVAVRQWVAEEHGGVALVATGHGLAAMVLLARAAFTVAGAGAGESIGRHAPTSLAMVVFIVAGLCTTLGIITTANGRLLSAASGALQQLAAKEERYRSLVDTSPDMIYQSDLRGYFTFCNPACSRLLGYERDELIGRHFHELVRPDFREVAEAFYRRQATSAKPSTYFEFPALAKNGREVWIGQNVQSVRDDGRLVGFEAVARDVTKRKRAELEAVNQSREERRRSEEVTSTLRREIEHVTRVATAGELATSLAHEVNQPLAAIVSNAQAGQRYLERGESGRAEVREILLDIARQGQRASEVIQRLREFLRKDRPERTPLEVSEVFQSVLPLLRRECEAWKIDLVVELDSDGAKVVGDRVQLQQVAVNLIQNACEAMRSAPLPHRLTLHSRSSAGRVEVSVTDTGPGVPKDIEARIFEPFVSSKSEGMGLGLSICRSLVESHGGTLRHQPGPDGGARFIVELPVAEESLDTSPSLGDARVGSATR
jgi:PAS domain S-box-containing protein